MASPAAVLSVLVQAEGIQRTNSQLRGLQGGLTQSSKAAGKIGTDLDKGSKVGSRALGGLKSAAGLAGIALGAAGIAGAMKTAIGEFQEARKVGANTNQVIKTTGGVANVSAKQVAALATSISKKVGIDDEAIQSGANLLLTFKNIRNETGKGRDIFNQATKAAVDLSAAGFGSLESTSKQLGKALNDPVKGMTALGRSGVTFSEQQKKAIEALLKTGKAADRVRAQQIILKEVQSQVGGQAEAQATTMDHLKVTLGNLAEAAGSVLVPALDKVGKFLNTVINQMIEGKGAGGAVVSTFRTVGITFGTVATAAANVVGWFKQHQTITLALAAAAGVLFAAYAGFTVFYLVTAAVAALRTAMLLLNASFLTNPVFLVIAALAALAAGVVIAYRESETFRKIVNAAWAVIKVVAAWLITAGVAAFKAVAAAVTFAWGVVKTVTLTVWGAVKAFLIPLWGVLKTLITAYFGAYKAVVTAVWGAIKTVTTAVWGAIKGVLVGAWAVIKTVATTEWALIKGVILTPIRAVRDALGGKDGIWAKIHDAAVAAWDKIKSAVGGFAKSVKTGVLDGIKGGLNVLIGFVNDVIKVINLIPGVPNIKPVAKLAEGGTVSKNGVQALAAGGIVRKPIVMMGEEAPRHPEYVIPTNPAYRKRAGMLLGQAASAIGFSTGGIFDATSYGPPWTGINGTGVTATGVNLQNSPHVYGVAVDPSVIALNSLMKIWPNPFGYRGKFSAFDTGSAIKGRRLDFYDWRGRDSQYGWGSKQVRVGGGAIGPSIGDIAGNVADALNPLDFIKKLPGIGDLPEWLQGTGRYILDKVGDWIKRTVSSIVPGGGGGTAKGPKGIGTFEGLPMANWVIGALKHARSKGFTGHPTSGYRSHAQNVAQGRNYFSEHEGTQYPHGAVDFGGFHSGLATKLAAVAATADYKYPLLAPIGFVDDGHASGTGHRMGGILGQGEPFVGSYARGGRVPADGYGYLHQGETVVPRGAAGPMVHVEHMEIRSDMDLERFSRSLGWQLATGGA